MSQHLQSAQQYHQSIREILLKEWDPIGIAEVLPAQDEYDTYVPQIYGLLLRREPVAKIFDYLWWAETENMGLCGNRNRTEVVANRLAQLGKANS